MEIFFAPTFKKKKKNNHDIYNQNMSSQKVTTACSCTGNDSSDNSDLSTLLQ